MELGQDRIYADLLEANVAELPYFRGFLRAVEARYYQAIVLPQPVLDMGAGDGHFAARTFKKKITIGLDPAFVSLNEAKGFEAYDLLLNSRGDRIPCKAESFACVISNSVLEHIPDVDAVLIEIYRIIKPGGKLVITVPNDRFTRNLSIALFLENRGWRKMADAYRKWFNRISRHYHPEAPGQWQKRLEDAGFQIREKWDYFPPESLRILEWGHYFGLPNWINKKILGRWVLFPRIGYNRMIFRKLLKKYSQEQKAPDGAYSLFVAQKA